MEAPKRNGEMKQTRLLHEVLASNRDWVANELHLLATSHEISDEIIAHMILHSRLNSSQEVFQVMQTAEQCRSGFITEFEKQAEYEIYPEK
jgi:hypothetical protein